MLLTMCEILAREMECNLVFYFNHNRYRTAQ